MLLQTRVPRQIGLWIANQATFEGLSVASWLRRLVLQEVHRMHTQAWVVSHDEDPVTYQQIANPALYILERKGDLSATEVAFWLLHGPSHEQPGKPVTPAWLVDVEWYKSPAGKRFVLEGSADRWRIMRTMHDHTAGRIELVLQVEKATSKNEEVE